MRIWGGLAAMVAAGFSFGGTASAEIVDSVKFGVMAHNVDIWGSKNSNKEDGPNVEAQVNFTSPEILHVLWAPQPYVMASVNTAGETSFGGVGLEWRIGGEKWAVEPGLGYVIHDGEIDLPYPKGDARNADFNRKHVLFGSRDLFRVSVGVTRELSEKWNAQVVWEHLSHGQILGSGRNQGVDELGVRLGYKFGPH